MPQGCGTWPAAWETDEGDWPNGGEVDIVGDPQEPCDVS
jgi:beta-glucanase (GH16 family)